MTTATFDDGKDDGALRTIGEVGKALGIKPHVLRYWEQQFPMLQPLKRSGGRRYYRPEDVELVETINDLVNEQGYTLKGAMKTITEQQRAPSAEEPLASSASDDASDVEPQQANAPAVASGIDIGLPNQLPSDGGLDTFFARSGDDNAPTMEGPEPDDVVEASSDEPQPKHAAVQSSIETPEEDRSSKMASILPELHQLRDRLAAALNS